MHSVRLDVISALLYVGQLAFRVLPPGLLRGGAGALTGAASVVARGGGAVLPALAAAGGRRRSGSVAGSAARAQARSVAGTALGGRVAGSGRPRVFVLAVVGTLASTGWLIYGALRAPTRPGCTTAPTPGRSPCWPARRWRPCMPLPRSPPRRCRHDRHRTGAGRWSARLALGGLMAIFARSAGRTGCSTTAVSSWWPCSSRWSSRRSSGRRAARSPGCSGCRRCPHRAHLLRPLPLALAGHPLPDHRAHPPARRRPAGHPPRRRARAGGGLVLADGASDPRPGGCPGPRLAASGLAGVIGLAGVAGPWSRPAALPTPAEPTSRRSSTRSPSAGEALSGTDSSAPAACRSPSRPPPPTPSPSPTLRRTPGLPPNGKPNVPPNPVPAEPLNVLLVGDSTALSAALALSARAVGVEGRT